MDAKLAPNRAATEAAFAAPWRMAAEAMRQQIEFAAESATVLFRGFEALGNVQSLAAREALDRHAAAARSMRGQPDSSQLATLPLDLMRFDLQRVVNYWQQMLAAAFETQARLVNCGLHLVNTDALLETAAAVHATDSTTQPAAQPAKGARPKRSGQ